MCKLVFVITAMEEAAWAAAIATFLAALVALFKEDIVYYVFWWHHPSLIVRTRRGAPDWAKTPIVGIYPEELPSGEQVQRWGPIADAYYFRIWVENTGRERAEDVQVYAAKLWKRQADSTFQPVNTFLPMNLRWAHSPNPAEPEIFDDMNPEMGRHCDLGHICDPARKAATGDEIAGVEAEKTIFHLELEIKPARGSHLLPPGYYRLELRVAAANARPITKILEINHTGRWFPDEEKMFDEGVGILEA